MPPLTATDIRTRLKDYAQGALRAWVTARPANLWVAIETARVSIIPDPTIANAVKAWETQWERSGSGRVAMTEFVPTAKAKNWAKVAAALEAAGFTVEYTTERFGTKVRVVAGPERVAAADYAKIHGLERAPRLPVPLRMDPEALRLKLAVVYLYEDEWIIAEAYNNAGPKKPPDLRPHWDRPYYRVPRSVKLPDHYLLRPSEPLDGLAKLSTWTPWPGDERAFALCAPYGADSTRYNIPGVFWTTLQGSGAFAATNGSQLQCVKVPFTPPSRTLVERPSTFGPETMSASYITSSGWSVDAGHVLQFSTLPDIEQVIPARVQFHAKVTMTPKGAKALIAAFDAARAGKPRSAMLQWNVRSNGGSKLHWVDGNGGRLKTVDGPDLDVDGDTRWSVIGFDADGVKSALTTFLRSKEPTWTWALPENDPRAPSLFYSGEYHDWRVLNVTMPVRVD